MPGASESHWQAGGAPGPRAGAPQWRPSGRQPEAQAASSAKTLDSDSDSPALDSGGRDDRDQPALQTLTVVPLRRRARRPMRTKPQAQAEEELERG